MGIYQAGNNKTGWAYESGTYGAALSGAAQWPGLVQDFVPADTQNPQKIRYHGTNSRNFSKFTPGVQDYGGEMTAFPQDFKFLMFVLGNGSDTLTGSPTYYSHVLSELNADDIAPMTSGARNPFTSFQFESIQHFGTGLNLGRLYKGCCVNSYGLSRGDSSEPLTQTMSFVAQDMDFHSGDGTAITTAATRRPYLPSDCLLQIPSGTFIEAKTWDFTVNNNFDVDSAHVTNGSRVIASPTATERDYEFSLTMDGQSSQANALYGKWKSGGDTTVNALLVLQNYGNAASGITSISMSGCDIETFDAPNPVEGIDEWSLTLIPRVVTVLAQDETVKYKAW